MIALPFLARFAPGRFTENTMFKTPLLTALVSVAALAAPHLAYANLLTNGSFEDGTFTPDANGVQRLGLGTTGPLPLAGLAAWVVSGHTMGWPSRRATRNSRLRMVGAP